MKKLVRIVIPDNIDFSDLQLQRDPDGQVSFSMDVVLAICAASNLDPEFITDGPEDNAAGLIVAWYGEHLLHDGIHDPVADDLIAEIVAEDELGGGFSFQPGRA